MPQAPIRAAITQADVFQLNGVPTASVVCTAGAWNKLGELITASGLYRFIGFGDNSSQADATGRILVQLKTAASAAITGRFRISIFTPQDRNLVTLGEWHTSSLDQNPTDRSKQLPNPRQMNAIGKDFKYVFEFKPDATATATLAQSVIVIDSTEQLMN